MTIGFTYDKDRGKYCLIRYRDVYDAYDGLCLACTESLDKRIKAFCLSCKAPRPVDWTTGNKSLDSLITKSWSNINLYYESYYIQWIEYSRLTDIQEKLLLERGCTHAANWLAPSAYEDELIKVTLKKIVDGRNAQLFDFYQVNYHSFIVKYYLFI